MTHPSHTLVIGGGVIGYNIALSLQAAGHTVVLCDDGQRSTSASYGNAGHIATEQVEPLASMAVVRSAWNRWFARGGALSLPARGFAAWLPFSLRLIRMSTQRRFAQGKSALCELLAEALPAWRRRVADIEAESLLQENGHFVVWESPLTAAKGLKACTGFDFGTASVRAATSDEMAQLSQLSAREIHGAVRFKGTAQIADTRRLLSTFEGTFIARGGQIVEAKAERLQTDADGTRVFLSGGGWHHADRVVIAAGIGSKALMQQVGFKVPMIAERGYHIQAESHGWPKDWPPVVFEDRSMIVTGFESGLRAASFVEFNNADALPDPRKWVRLRKHVSELGLPFKGVGSEWIGSRPTLPDYLPAIGRASSSLYYAFGHQHLGLTLGAVTGEIVTHMLDTGQAPKALDLRRFH